MDTERVEAGCECEGSTKDGRVGNSNGTPTARTGQGVQPLVLVVPPHGCGWIYHCHCIRQWLAVPLMYCTVPPEVGAETMLQRNYWMACILFWKMGKGFHGPRDQGLGFPWRQR